MANFVAMASLGFIGFGQLGLYAMHNKTSDSYQGKHSPFPRTVCSCVKQQVKLGNLKVYAAFPRNLEPHATQAPRLRNLFCTSYKSVLGFDSHTRAQAGMAS